MPEQSVGRTPGGQTMVPVAEAAARLGVPASRVRTWLKAGRLSGIKVLGQWRVPAVAVAELASSEHLRGQSRRLASHSASRRHLTGSPTSTDAIDRWCP